MSFFPACIVVALAPFQDGSAIQWRALPLPSLCRSAPPALETPRLVKGTHLAIAKEDLEPGLSPPSAAAFSAVAFSSLLADEARRETWNVTLHPSSPPLLVRGPLAGCQAASAFCEQIDALSRGLDVELSVWLVRGSGASAAQAAAPKDAPWASTRLRSGVETMLGERDSQSYVHNYSVEVATDAGVAAPVIGRALTGDVLHLRAMRVRGGTALFVEGLLDLSRLDSMQEFELSATDLGSVQHPKLSVLQVAFSGTVASGAPLRVAWSALGASEAMAEGSLWIVPRATPDSGEGRWRLLDAALLDSPSWELPQIAPGGGLELAVDTALESETPQAFPSAQLAKEGDSARTGNSRSRALFAAGNGIVLGPRAEQEGWAAIDDLRGAIEAVRTRTAELAVQCGAGSVRLPVAGGTAWRVLVCEETTAVIDYDVEIAPETWMPGPRVERSMDGFCAQGLAGADLTSYSAWVATTPEKKIAERSSIPLGRLELSRRKWRSSRGEVRAGPAPVVVLGGATPLSISVRVP